MIRIDKKERTEACYNYVGHFKAKRIFKQVTIVTGLNFDSGTNELSELNI